MKTGTQISMILQIHADLFKYLIKIKINNKKNYPV